MKIILGVSKNMGKTLNHPFVHRLIPYTIHFGGVSPYFWKHAYDPETLTIQHQDFVSYQLQNTARCAHLERSKDTAVVK